LGAAFTLLSAFSAGCGSGFDLVIGRNASTVGSGGSSAEAGLPNAGEANVGGTSAGGPSVGGAADAGAGAEAGASGAGPLLCDNGELPPVASLVHRYAFDGTGTVIGDAVGTAPGALIATDDSALDGNGSLVLKGGLSYVDLPNGLISSLTNATLMAWISWPQGGAAFQRIFDFGETNRGTLGEDPLWEKKGDYQGVSYLAAATLSNWGPGHSFGVELKMPTTSAMNYGAFQSLKDSDVHQVSVVFESTVGVRLYLDGLPMGSLSAPLARLSDIRDVNNWLGRSQTESDNPLRGFYYEFRIYDAALSECAIAGQYLAGPDSPAP
jgi:hypothetical protein